MLQHRIPEQSSGAAEQQNSYQRRPQEAQQQHSSGATTAAAELPHSYQQLQQNAKKSTGNGLFQTPTPTKNITFGMRHVACMLYITHYLSISHVPISPPCVDYRPTKSSLSFFCHAVTPCLSSVCRVLCRNVVFYSIRMRKR